MDSGQANYGWWDKSTENVSLQRQTCEEDYLCAGDMLLSAENTLSYDVCFPDIIRDDFHFLLKMLRFLPPLLFDAAIAYYLLSRTQANIGRFIYGAKNQSQTGTYLSFVAPFMGYIQLCGGRPPTYGLLKSSLVHAGVEAKNAERIASFIAEPELPPVKGDRGLLRHAVARLRELPTPDKETIGLLGYLEIMLTNRSASRKTKDKPRYVEYRTDPTFLGEFHLKLSDSDLLFCSRTDEGIRECSTDAISWSAQH